MEAARSSETLEQAYNSTWFNNPEDGHLSNTRSESLKTLILLSSKGYKLQTWEMLNK
jgi:hypothetical protein